MSFLEKLLRRKAKSRPITPAPFSDAGMDPVDAARAAMEAMKTAGSASPSAASNRFPKLSNSVGVQTVSPKRAPVPGAKDGTAPMVNIWDLEEEPITDSRPVLRDEPSAPDPTPRRRPNRAKTRMLGFEPSEASVVPLFDSGTKADEDAEATGKPAMVMFPTGWLIVKDGPGRGASFPLTQGMSVIGRGADQSVSLDFGDMSISRSNHAAVAFDPVVCKFHIGHGGKSNLVRLNGKPLLTTEELGDGDEIQIGETTLLIKVLCTPEFNWAKGQLAGDGHDMAIA